MLETAAPMRRNANGYRRRFGTALLVSAGLHSLLLFGFPVPPHWSEISTAPHIGHAGPELHIGELNPQEFPLDEQENLASARRQAGAMVDERITIETESAARERILERIGTGVQGLDEMTNPVLELTEDWAVRSTSAPSSRASDFVILHMVRPEYPRIAIDADIEGLVKVQARIDTEGKVTEVEVLESEVDASCEEETLRAMRLWRFRPYRIGGRPVPFSVIVPFRFRLE
jgi:TonB family protein